MVAFEAQKKDVRKVAIKAKEDLSSFQNQHLSGINDPLTFVVKCHLSAENLLNDLISSCLSKPDRLLRRMQFSQKVDLFESLYGDLSAHLTEKIRCLNKLRNGFVHEINKQVTEQDIEPLVRGLKIDSKSSVMRHLSDGVGFVFGGLLTFKAVNDMFPFFTLLRRNKSLLAADTDYKEIEPQLKKICPWSEVWAVL